MISLLWTIFLYFYTEKKEETRANYEYPRTLSTRDISDREKCWLNSEPSWREMYESRHKEIGNPVKKLNLEFRYDESYNVDVNAALQFGLAYWKIGLNANAESEKFVAVKWNMEVEFFTVIF